MMAAAAEVKFRTTRIGVRTAAVAVENLFLSPKWKPVWIMATLLTG
jgi:hypothetical protein